MYNGIVNVYKEQGYTSHDVVAKLRGIFGQKKVGHTGTLDPMAEGVLIVLLGQATRLSDLILTSSKRYIATARLGVVTDTDDISGNVTGGSPLNSLEAMPDRDVLEGVLEEFLGSSMQIPPMYSAIKVNGKKLYEYARAGIVIERQPRPIEIYRLELIDINPKTSEFSFLVECSKGTYIRSLIRDMGDRLGFGATMSALKRDEVNGIRCEDGYKINDLQKLKQENRLDDAVMTIDSILKDVPSVSINQSGEKLLTNGNRLAPENLMAEDVELIKSAEFFRVYMNGQLRALYSFDKEKNNYKVFKML